jgi:putative protease
LRILCRSLQQLDAVISCDIRSVMVEFADIREYRPAVAKARAANVEIYLATPRIQKPDELGVFHAMARHVADGWLVRNLAGIEYCREHNIPFVADFSLNAANGWTVGYLRSLGARRVTVSYDLNRDQLLELIDTVPPAALEVVIHQHMPMFHMEHCVFCAVLSPGTNKTNCGRPCDVHQVKLRDRIGMEHVLTADVGCRNTLYNAVPQSAAEATPQLLARGMRDFRLELLTDSASEVRTLVQLYRDLLAGRVTGQQVWQQLKASNRVGVTRGTLEERRNPLAIL